MIGIPSGMPGYSTLGDLYLRSLDESTITDYRRQLDLDTGVVRTTYTMGGAHFTREVFASVPDEVIVVRLTADRKGLIGFRATMDRPSDFTCPRHRPGHTPDCEKDRNIKTRPASPERCSCCQPAAPFTPRAQRS